MPHLHEWLARVVGIFRRRAADQRIAEEVDLHLEMLAAKHVRRGLSPREARMAARREFGGVTQMQEQYREQSRLPALDSLWSDLVFARRSFAKTPGVTMLIILTLGLGIGANTAIFSFLNELLFRPLPYHDPEQLVTIGRTWPSGVGATAPRDFSLIRDKARSFEVVGTMFLHRGENVETPGASQHVVCLRVSEGYFRALGTQPFLGRTFAKEEDIPNGPKVVVLSYGLWQGAFASDRNVLGRAVKIAGVPHTIIGVMPEAFSARLRARMWLPLQTTGQRNDTNYTMVARLATGVTPKQATAEVDALFRELDRETEAQVPQGQRYSRRPGIVVPLQETSSSEFRQPVLLLYGGVCIVLFVACLNVANLLLSRSAARAKEVAVRTALGAGRWRIVRQMLTESVLLAGLGCAAGLLLGRIFVWGLTRLAPYPPPQNVMLDGTTLAFTLAVSFVAGIGFGLAPALHSLRLQLNETLKESGGGKTSAGRSALRGRQALVVSQVALCTLLLAGAGLLVRTILNLRAVEMGFDPRHLLTAPMALNADKLAGREVLTAYYEQTMSRVRAIPGVTSVAVTTQLPVEGQMNLPVELLDSTEPQRTRSLQFRAQTRDAFHVLGMRIVRGRDFADADRAGTPPVAVVNEAFAREFFSGQDVLGKRISMRRLKVTDVWTVTGVVNDVREMGLKRPAPPAIYTLVDQVPQSVVKLIHSFVPAKWVIRVQPGTSDVVAQVRQTVGSLDPAQPFQQFEWMESVVARTMQMERFLTVLLGAFALLTLVMVATGLYGTLAYAVVQRRQEIGIRMALGARGANIIAMVAGSGVAQVGCGLAIGLTASYWATRLMTGFLFNLSALDPISLSASAALLIAVSLFAGLGPTLTAVRTDPLRTLRVE